MKLLHLFFVASTLLACKSESKPSHDEPGTPADLANAASFDLSSCAERAMTAEEFLRCCQTATGFNFTYAQDLIGATQPQEIRFEGPKRVPAAEFERFLTTQLARCGLTCRPLGPAKLRVFLVERSKAS